MSLRDITWAIEEAECPTAHATLVLIIFANFANADGRAYPCAETVAAKSKQNIKTVRAAIDALEDVGFPRRHIPLLGARYPRCWRSIR